MKALQIHAGPTALAHLRAHGLRPRDVRTIPAAAGGPKGLILGPLDRFVFGHWLAQSQQPIDLVGASIGAWRMAAACLPDAAEAFARFEQAYIAQDHRRPERLPGPLSHWLSERFAQNLQDFYGGQIEAVLRHPRYRLHVVTSRGRHLLAREHRLRTPLGYLGAFVANSVHRKALGLWLERVVFSAPQAGALPRLPRLPFATHDLRTRQVALTPDNFLPALQASCSIPFMLQAVHDIPGAPRGAYWDGGITDYHLHLAYRPPEAPDFAPDFVATKGVEPYHGGQFDAQKGLVLYPHFQSAVVPGWLDKGLRWRHRATAALNAMVVLSPRPDWVRRLPRGKLPDRNDFVHYQNDHPGRVAAWSAAASVSQQLADEFAQWLERPDPALVQPL